MANDEMIWDEAAGKLVPKSGYKKEAVSSDRDVDRDKRPTRKHDTGGSPAGAKDTAEEAQETNSTSAPPAGSLGGPPKRVARASGEKTTAHGADNEHDEKTAGWLAFLDRSVKGGFSVVRPGQNSIGRGPENHIVIAGERTVTREAAAFIIVDPEDGSAHLRSGTGRSIVRVNGELIPDSKMLAPGDQIQIGKVTCMYVPFPWDAVTDDEDDGDG